MIAGLVLAGGQATRLGGVDKALLPLGPLTVLDELIARLRPQTSMLAISANGDPARFARFGLPVLPDEVTGRGPLGGVLRGLGWAASHGADWLLSVPGDTPFIPPDLARRLSPGPSWAATGETLHPLVALWPTPCAPQLATWLAAHQTGRVRAFGQTIGMRTESFAAPPDPFHNINTPEDLAAARARV